MREHEITDQDYPELFFHGTNLISALLIVRDNTLKADDPSDGDQLGYAVCVSSDAATGAEFATEYVRDNSRLDVGVVFVLDAHKVASTYETVPYEAESASKNEYEYRILSDITPLTDYLEWIEIVGDDKPFLRDRDFLLNLYEDEALDRYFRHFDNFHEAVEGLIQISS